jgi:hypothetical protein
MVLGGRFTTVSQTLTGTTMARSNLMAFNATTGTLTSFAPERQPGHPDGDRQQRGHRHGDAHRIGDRGAVEHRLPGQRLEPDHGGLRVGDDPHRCAGRRRGAAIRHFNTLLATTPTALAGWTFVARQDAVSMTTVLW